MFLPGESRGRGSLVGCRLWGHKESDTTEVTQQQHQHHRYAEHGRAIFTAPGDGRDRLGQSDAWLDGHSLKDRHSWCHLNPWQIHLRVVHDNSWSIHVGKTGKFKMQREAQECEKSHLAYLRTPGPVQKAPKTFVPHQKVPDTWSHLVLSKMTLRQLFRTKGSLIAGLV